MLHSRSLKIIGQALETAKITTFKVDVKSDVYRVFVGDVMFRFDATGLSRVSALIQTNKPHVFVQANRVRSSLSEQLRAVGDFADRMEVDEFRIVWTQNFAILDYEEADAELSHRVFTAQELQELALHPSLPRSVSYFVPRLGYWS
jgi:aspartyl-tRNA synthetase